MNWCDERYVRVYVRDTEDLLAIGWEGRTVLWELCRKADRIGMVHATDPVLLAEMLRLPADLCKTALERVVSRGIASVTERGILIRNFLEAQEAPASGAARARTWRERRRLEGEERRRQRDTVTKRDDTVTKCDTDVTTNNEAQREVTPDCAVPSRTVPSRIEEPLSGDARPGSNGHGKNGEAKRVALEYVSWFNRNFQRAFTARADLVKLVGSLMAKGYTLADMKAVSWIHGKRWMEKPEMAEYAVPASLLRTSKFGGRLDEANEIRAANERKGHDG